MTANATPPRMRWHSAGAIERFADRHAIGMTLAGTPVGIVRVDGAFHAFRNECPHQGAPLCAGRFAGTMIPSRPNTLEYGLEYRVIRCPWHGWEFDVESGDAVFGITRRRLLMYETEQRDGELYIQLPPTRRQQQEENEG